MAISFDYLPSAVNDRAMCPAYTPIVMGTSAQLVKLKCKGL